MGWILLVVLMTITIELRRAAVRHDGRARIVAAAVGFLAIGAVALLIGLEVVAWPTRPMSWVYIVGGALALLVLWEVCGLNGLLDKALARINPAAPPTRPPSRPTPRH